jgi:hypothetical protein
MERSQILLIVGGILVVGFVGFQMFSGGADLDEGIPLSRLQAERRAAAGDDESGGGAADSTDADVRGGGGEIGRSRSSGTGGTGSRRSDAGARREPGSRLSQTALASRGNRGGTVGSGGTGTRSGGGSASVFDRSSSRRMEADAPRRSDVVEYLASHPSSAGRSRDSDDGEEEDIALELKRPEDTEPAAVKRGVEAPDESDEGLTFTEGSRLAFPDAGNVQGEAGTISFELEPKDWNIDSNHSLVTLRDEHGWSNRIELVKNGRYLRFILADNNGREADISVPIDAWSGEAHDIKATWGEQKTALYIDGVKVGENHYTEFIRPDAMLHVGSDHRGSTYSGASATFRRFKVTNSASF